MRAKVAALSSELIPYMAVGVVLIALAGSAAALAYTNYRDARAGSDIAALAAYLRNVHAAVGYPEFLTNETTQDNLPAGFTGDPHEPRVVRHSRLPDVEYEGVDDGRAYQLEIFGQASGKRLSSGSCGEIWQVLALQLNGEGTRLEGAGATGGPFETTADALRALSVGVVADGADPDAAAVACEPTNGLIGNIVVRLR